MLFLIPFFISVLSIAGNLEVVSTDYKFQEALEFQAILANLKTYGEFSAKAIPIELKTLEPPLSRGAQIVEEAKAKNRALIAAGNKQETQTNDSANLSELDKWKLESKKSLKQWKKESKDQLNNWKKEQEIFLGKIKVYKANTFELPAKIEKIIEEPIPTEVIPEVYVVNGAFKVPVRDQSARPTCVAFAGVRAIEIILAQNKQEKDLSEQYLYWSGKPKCQNTPCAEKGSWIVPAYQYSQRHAHADIPLEVNCAYNAFSQESNETQIPLPLNCIQGFAKVLRYEEVRTISEVVENIKKDRPVIVAAKLSENFYKNAGLITFGDSQKKVIGKLDLHAMGHAFLAIGIMQLPEKLVPNEGKFCIIVANSWGKGWGAGGYSCITQKWFEIFRQPSPFISVTNISIK